LFLVERLAGDAELYLWRLEGDGGWKLARSKVDLVFLAAGEVAGAEDGAAVLQAVRARSSGRPLGRLRVVASDQGGKILMPEEDSAAYLGSRRVEIKRRGGNRH
jgi:hypothetical protein